MSVSRLGSVAALLGGLVWVAAAVLSWGDDELNRGLYLAGLVLLVASFAALGYSLVATAPVWLRAVVTIATPLLGLMVWLILRDSIPADYVAAVVGGVLLFLGGGIALSRAGSAPAKAEPPARGRRAAR
ncbi:MAG: hypothetical protein ACXWDI_11505 [Nocardioides sp.]